MIHADVQVWLDRYVAAWSSYDAAAIGDLFSEDAEYRYQPWADPIVGRDAIVADWLKDKDEPGSWTAHYDVLDPRRRPGVGHRREPLLRTRTARSRRSTTTTGRCRFDGHGRCVEFVEYYMKLPERLSAGR